MFSAGASTVSSLPLPSLLPCPLFQDPRPDLPHLDAVLLPTQIWWFALGPPDDAKELSLQDRGGNRRAGKAVG
jgi:hypothetical protein